MKSQLLAIKKILSRKNYLVIFFVSSPLYGILFAVMTNLIDVRQGMDYITIAFTKVSATFFILFSILGGLLITLQIFAIKNRQITLKSANVGFFGAFISFFTTTCPFCKPLLLSLVGFTGSLAILKYGTALALLSVLLLLVSIYLIAIQVCKCEICLIDKNKKH